MAADGGARNMLYSLEMQDFKSYRGKQTIGPFYRFTAIVGPNGSGKSNLMDAICFVLGEKANNLRVRKMTDLIHGAPIGKPVANKCFVTMNFINEHGQKIAYTRRVTGGSSEYLIGGQVVTTQQYNQAMESLKVFIKAKNFLVYQGQVEQIAMKNPKERTALFEELSRSSEFAGDYERLKNEMQKAEQETQTNMNKRRGIAAEKREARQEREEAERYQQQRDELRKKQEIMHLMELYDVEELQRATEEDLAEKKVRLRELHAEKEEAENALKTVQHNQRGKMKALQQKEKNKEKKDKDVVMKRPQANQAHQEVLHCENKLQQAKKALAALEKQKSKNDAQLKELQKKERELKERRAQTEKALEAESEASSLNLSQDQIDEYIRLKKEAGKLAGDHDVKLTRILKDNEEDRSAMEFEQRKVATANQQLKMRQEDKRKREEKEAHLQEQIVATETAIREAETEYKEATSRVVEGKEEIEKLESKLKEVTAKLADAAGDSFESERDRKRKECVENLQRVFPDKVFGRLIDVCQPSHKRFQLAVTKLLQKHMGSIVCDTDQTAREAIAYLKEQRYFTETFLPLSVLDVQPINERLRNIKKPAGVKLLFDVITCQTAVRKAVQFACGNALVVENPEDARYLAYGESGERHKAVALDGTLFNPSGLISGGGQDLKRTAKRWDDAGVKKLQAERKAIHEQLGSMHRTRTKEMDIEMKHSKMQSLKAKCMFLKQELTRVTHSIGEIGVQIEVLEAEIETSELRINETKERMAGRQAKIDDLQAKAATLTDSVFADFCKRIGVKDIREYENREMKFHEEKKSKLLEIDKELDLVRNEINYFQQENGQAKLDAEAAKVRRLEADLKTKKSNEAKLRKELEKLEEDLGNLEVEVKEMRVGMEKEEAELAEAKKAVQTVSREVAQEEKAVNALENNIHRRRTERHRLLRDAKINQIAIPLTAGSLADVDAEDEGDEDDEGEGTSDGRNESHVSQDQLNRELKIKIKFTALPDDYKKIDGSLERRKRIEKMAKDIAEMQEQLSRVQAPNLKASERLEAVRDNEDKVNEQFESARKKARKVRSQFEKVKTDRYRRFQACFEPVSQKIDDIYKALSRDQSAQAFLGPDNTEEPYLEGIQYNCIAPGKRFRPMDNLSGGEKTVAALALLFAMHSINPSPFFVLDEVDAALDNTNIGKVAGYIMEKARNDMQIIVISLKEEFYNKADALVGIYPVPANCTVSGVLTMDLTTFRTSGGHDATMREGDNSTVAGSER